MWKSLSFSSQSHIISPIGVNMSEKKNPGTISMFALALPLCLEQGFRILVSSIDTVMLSGYDNAAVAAVGMTSQYAFFINILYNVVCVGTMIVLSQYIGAKKSNEELGSIAKASVIMVVSFSVIMSLVVIFGTASLLSCYTLEESVRKYALDYFVIFCGFGSVFIAFNLMQGAIVRAYGHTKQILLATILANLINVIGNALSLYGWFGLPVFGLRGVACSSVIGNVFSCVYLSFVIKRNKEIQFSLKNLFSVDRIYFKKILRIGVPTAGENLSYNVAQIVIMAMITTLGTAAMSAQVYTQTICRFVFVVAVGIGSATQIKTGYFVGSKNADVAYRNLWRYQFYGTMTSMILIVLINLGKGFIVPLFTKDPVIVGYVSSLLLYSCYIEFGRSLNLISIGGLKGAGDVGFPVGYGIFSMWCIMVLFSYILGLKMELGLIGFWLAIGTDETTRGLVMLLRWKSKRWQTKALV